MKFVKSIRFNNNYVIIKKDTGEIFSLASKIDEVMSEYTEYLLKKEFHPLRAIYVVRKTITLKELDEAIELLGYQVSRNNIKELNKVLKLEEVFQ